VVFEWAATWYRKLIWSSNTCKFVAYLHVTDDPRYGNFQGSLVVYAWLNVLVLCISMST